MNVAISNKWLTLFEQVRLCAGRSRCYPLLRRIRLHHPQTYEHSIRVAGYAVKLCEALGFGPSERESVLCSALLHDVGKLSLSAALLDKPGALLPAEWEMMKNHCRSGEALIRLWSMAGLVDCDMILYHHENVDGSGYYALPGAELSLSVKLLRVADSFDAMTFHRSYRRQMSHAEAFEELIRCSRTCYDPFVADVFCQVMNDSA